MNPSPRSRNAVRTAAGAVVLTVVALTAAACGGGGGGSAAGPTSPPTVVGTAPPGISPPTTTPASAAPVVGRTHAVGVRTDTYVDPARPTAAIPGYAGAPDRTLAVTVWYPATGDPGGGPVADAPPDVGNGPYPLVVFSHGYAVAPDFYGALLARWAAAGYVVVAPTYPLLSGVPAGPSHADYGEVFADQRFVLGEVLADTVTAGGSHPLAGLVDPARIATAGQSDGEVAAFGAGFLECCRDPRVKAVIAMAGNLGNINNPVRRDSRIPVMHLTGDADELQPYVDAIAWDRDNLTAPRWLVTLVGGGHASPYRDPDDPHFAGVVEMTTAFLDSTLKGDRTRAAAVDAVAAAAPDQFRLER